MRSPSDPASTSNEDAGGGSTSASASRPSWRDADYFGPGATIRTVTPESVPDECRRLPDALGPLSTPASPRSLVQESPQSLSRSQQRARAGSNNDMAQGVVLRREPAYVAVRPRTRTIDGHGSRETSPPAAAFLRARTRMGSSNSVSVPFGVGVEDVVTSIGHPSTIPHPAIQAARRKGEASKRLALLNSLPRDSLSMAESPARAHPAGGRADPRYDMRRILGLMKSSCGKMEGQLAFRRFETTPWSLSYCSINDESGSLVYEPKSNDASYRTLIPDIRGCMINPAWDEQSQMSYLDICPQNSKMRVHLRPHSPDEFEAWYAALLCWQPIRPKGAQNRMTKPQVPVMGDGKLSSSRRHSELALHKELPIIKIGKMLLWHTVDERSKSKSDKRWQLVSSTLRENGELKLHSEQDMSLLTTVHLSQLSRCAIQRLHPSVLNTEFCIGIYPQYPASANAQSLSKPVFLALESRILYEVWVVLLRAFTIPQLYGPKQALAQNSDRRQSFVASSTDMFRMERSLSVRVAEARLVAPLSPHLADRTTRSGSKDSGFYVEVLLDGETRAKTNVRAEELSLSWREDFEFIDLPAPVSVASIILKRRRPRHRRSKDESKKHGVNGTNDAGPTEHIYGQVEIFLDDLQAGKEVDKWWPLVNQYGQGVGEISLRVVADESVILMAKAYQPLSEQLHRFSNSLTLHISQKISQQLKRLSDTLLNIFQVSGHTSEWIVCLAEEEIDGTLKSESAGFTSRLRFNNRRMSANESGEITAHSPMFDRELFLRDMGKSATVEANLLFRGNTILTKALDYHMKRLGKDYLEETLGEKMRMIAEKDPDCEVDPNKIGNHNELDRNWRKLIALTKECWTSIRNSATKCPPELRFIFRHIRACAEDRFGDFHRAVAYSSVSGFLFLRFFVPAILNPQLFGLLKDSPSATARRTFTLLAKSLQGLANLSSFGAKEEWMEPMNTFLNSYRNEFKHFLDDVCDVPSGQIQVNIPPSYLTPLNILNRLPPTSREGFPSLPHLIDHAKSFATLVGLWLDNCPQDIATTIKPDSELATFHNTCLELRRRTDECLARAERAERPSSQSGEAWEELVGQLETDTQSTTSSATAVEDGSNCSRALLAEASSGRPSATSRTPSDSPLSLRPWRGPGRQLSLEILPSPRGFGKNAPFSAQEQSHAGFPHKSYHNQQSPASNATSPLAGSGDSAAEDALEQPHGRKHSMPSGRSSSGRTTPAGRSMADMRIHPWSYGHAVGALRDLAERGRRQRSPDTGSGGGGAGASADWSGERVFVREGAGSAPGQQRRQQHVQHQHQHSQQHQRGSSAKAARVSPATSQVNASASALASSSSRQPRRDWGTEERAKREERTVGILGASSRGGSSRASPEPQPEREPESEQDRDDDDDDEETTALPQLRGRTSKSGDREREREREQERERHLLDRMMFKKKKGTG